MRPVRERPFTGKRSLRRSDTSTRPISPIWRISTSAGGPVSMAYQNLYAPQAKVLHAGSGTSGSRYNEFKVTLSSRNNIWIIYKNMPLFQRMLNLPFFLIGFGAKQLFFCKKGLGGIYARGILTGIRTCDRGKKVPFKWKHFPAYVRIQLELWRNIVRKVIV